MKIMKFGGSSMANADTIQKVSQIVLHAARTDTVSVVVSACQGITDLLLECGHLAAQGDKKHKKCQQLFQNIARHHLECLEKLTSGKTGNSQIPPLLHELENLLSGIALLHEATPSSLDHVASFGERLSAELLALCLQPDHPAIAVDTRDLIQTDDCFMAANVNIEQTRRRLHRWHTRWLATQRDVIPVMTGFIAATKDGRTTTLGRNGSDYSAAIIGAALPAQTVEIWTDVDGVYSADPGMVPEAFVVPELSFEEAMELSHFGAKVLHPATLAPLRDQNIPILVKNTFHPEANGTRISTEKNHPAESADIPQRAASGITSIDNITLLSWSGQRQTAISNTVERLFRVLSDAGVNIFLVSQASSQHTLTLAIRSSEAARALEMIRDAFRMELKHKLVRLEKKSGQIIIAIVGDGMRGVPGVAGKMFHSLGQQNISIRAISQGASEHNISLVVDGEQEARALNLVHDAFFSHDKKLGLILAGTGNVGSTLLDMLARQSEPLRKKGFHLRLCGVANSRRQIFENNGILPATAISRLKDPDISATFDLDALLAEAKHADFLPMAFVDCTASSDLVAHYPAIIRAGLHIITPNKKASVQPLPAFHALMETFRQHERHFLYQTTVGAGLPVLSTLKDLIAGGDKILRIEGILSGTLSWLFNHYDGTLPFADVLRQTQEAGLTEPDPRDDLSGMDVTRKLVIMARELGYPMELSDIKTENLVPDELRAGHFTSAFYEHFRKHEKTMQKKLRECREKGAVLRYVGTLANGKAEAGLRFVPIDHPLARTGASDNIIAITSERYQATPLVIQGLGAGATVTAMGVFSDILRLLHYLPW